jgi:hypothetical protein
MCFAWIVETVDPVVFTLRPADFADCAIAR